MIRLTVSDAPRWIDLPNGVRIHVRPLSSSLVAASASEATRRTAAMQREADDQAKAGLPLDDTAFNAANVAVLNGLFYQFQTEAMLRMGGLAWEGVADEAGGTLELNAETAAAFAAVPSLADAFRRAYDEDHAVQVQEGNGSSPTSAGGMAVEASTAPAARSGEASPETQTAPSAESAPAS